MESDRGTGTTKWENHAAGRWSVSTDYQPRGRNLKASYIGSLEVHSAFPHLLDLPPYNQCLCESWSHRIRSTRKLFAGLLPHHVLGVPIGPILICCADALLVLAMSGGGAPKRARQVACGPERSCARVDASGKSGRNLLEQPDVAVWIAERGARAVGATFGIQTVTPAFGAEVKELADLDAGGNQLAPRDHDIRNDQV